jgi:hypothetical protein
MLKDLISNIDPKSILIPAVRTADATSSAVDLQDDLACVLLAHVGLSGDTLSGSVKIEFEVQHSDDNSSYSACADADLSAAVTGTNTGTFAVVDAAADDEQMYKVAYIGNKRYLKVVANFTGTHTNGCPVAVEAVLKNMKKPAL